MLPRRLVLLPLLPLALLALARLPLALPATAADPMRAIASSPSPQSVIEGRNEEFFVRFDRPVDHNLSRLILAQGDQVVRVLQPRLRARPDTLYAVAGNLPAGDYMLRWVARSMGGENSEGQIAFRVQP
jgi:methionine-rich copper-binding protein CopC